MRNAKQQKMESRDEYYLFNFINNLHFVIDNSINIIKILLKINSRTVTVHQQDT